MIARALLVGILLLPWYAQGGIENLYDRATLSYWQTQTPPGIRAALEDIRGVLTRDERNRLRDIILEFPIDCPRFRATLSRPAKCLDPFTFIASNDGKTIYMSMTSLRFWGDIALAFAWLKTHGKAIDSVLFYVSMLRERSALNSPGVRYPRPLEALGIPDNARSDDETYRLFQGIYVGGLYYVLAHELAHQLFGDRGYSDGNNRRAREAEARADRWALEVMAKLGQAPGGAVYFLTVLGQWSPSRADFASDSAYRRYLEGATHPLTGDRMLAVADAIEANLDAFALALPPSSTGNPRQSLRAQAEQIRKLGQIFDQAGVHSALEIQGRSLSLDDLKPRPEGTPIGWRSSSQRTSSGKEFDGYCTGNMNESGTRLDLVMSLKRQGDRVRGWYTLGVGKGRVEGQVRDGRLYFDWSYEGDRGRGVARNTAGQLVGQWGYGLSESGGGTLDCKFG
jgi:hypothetical protein